MITFNIVVTNAGPANAADVVVTDVLPAGLTFLSALPGGACTGAPTVVCSLGTIANGATTTVSIRARLDSSGDFMNSAAVSSPTADEDAADNSNTISFAVNAAAMDSVPALDTTMQIVLAVLMGALAIGILGRR